MARVSRQEIGTEGWPGGVAPATDATFSDITCSPHGYNSALASATAGKPFIQKRMGLATINDAPVTGSPAIIGQFTYTQLSTATDYNLLVSDSGQLAYRDTGGTVTIISSPFTAGMHYPHFAVANDLCFIVNGSDAKKLRGNVVENFGIVRPTVGSLAGAAGAAGGPNGTYELRETFYNGNTGHESSASNTSAATVTVTNQKISVTNVAISSDAQVTARRIYVRNTATQSLFYLAGTISDNSTTTITLDFLDANLVTVAPSTTENNPPPSGIKYLAFHQGRLFAATDSGLYWSALNKPEAFDPLNYDPVNASDGQKIMATHSAHEILMILKEGRFYVLYGSDPNAWYIKLASPDYGCLSFRTVLTRNGATWWYSNHGIVNWPGAGDVAPIGRRYLGDTTDTIDAGNIATACACGDDANSRLLFAVPELGQSRATMILPINYLLNVFESDKWDPMDVASLGEAKDAVGVWRPFLGNYAGQVFQVFATNNDGVPDGTVSGTFVPATTDITTITDATATFHTTGGKLIERKVTVFDANGKYYSGSIRPRITGNTGTVLTLSTTLSGFVVGQTYTYYIGGPDFQFDTPWLAGGNDYFTKERYDWLLLLIRGVVNGIGSSVDLSFDQFATEVDPKSFSAVSNQTTSQWDDPYSLWDVSVWDIPNTSVFKYRVHRVGKSWRARIRNSAPNQPIALLRIAMQSVMQTIKA